MSNSVRHDQFPRCSVWEGCASDLAKFDHVGCSVVKGDVLELVLDDKAVAVVAAAFESEPV